MLHKYKDGNMKVVANDSRSLIAAEKNIKSKRNALEITLAVKHFTDFYTVEAFVHKLITIDHCHYLCRKKEFLPILLIQRWSTILLSYGFKMECIPSKKLGYAVCLSRLISKNVKLFEDTMIDALQAENEIRNVLCNVIRELSVTLQDRMKIRKR
ncbi:uncharacterized protein LOC115219657 [Octopus sinensis]|uniref:Uncharacterized protein LOC115219657 n=1 Tax=Octopus sinensis TaxID=2607531 RepID=A0A6P7T789_9MOLL|nr:uncharacterized protein LOC115219657 [Octopus sinensis]